MSIAKADYVRYKKLEILKILITFIEYTARYKDLI
jgi:hypothetical protein